MRARTEGSLIMAVHRKYAPVKDGNGEHTSARPSWALRLARRPPSPPHILPEQRRDLGLPRKGFVGEHTEGGEDQVIRMLPITTICAKRTCWIHSLEATRPHLRPRPKPLIEHSSFLFAVNHFHQKLVQRCHLDVDLLAYVKEGKESCRYRSQ